MTDKPVPRLNALRWALATFTICPVGEIRPVRGSAATAMLLAPVAVLPLAGVVGLLALLPGPPMLVAVLMVAALAFGTRAMHLDALCDVVDALGGGWTPERAREILHRGDVGPMGVTALVLCLLGQVAAIVHILPGDGMAPIVGAVIASRCAVTVACCRFPSIPGSRLGAVVAGSVPVGGVVASLVVGSALLALINPWSVVVTCATWLVVWLLVAHARRRFGGVNGDVMGAAIEVAFTVMLLGLAWLSFLTA